MLAALDLATKEKERKEGERKEKIQREKWKDVQTRKGRKKEGGKRERRGEGGRGRKGVNGMCSAALKGRGTQDLAAVGFAFSHRVRHHINPSLLSMSPGWC